MLPQYSSVVQRERGLLFSSWEHLFVAALPRPVPHPVPHQVPSPVPRPVPRPVPYALSTDRASAHVTFV
eukprot:155486-Chlamydomonas_euryale.AAC.1